MNLIDTTVECNRPQLKILWNIKRKLCCSLLARADPRIDSEIVRTGRITNRKNIFRVKAILPRMLHHKLHHKIRIFNRRRELVLRCKPVCKIHHSKSMLHKTHTIILVQLLIAIYPASAMHTDNDRQLLTLPLLRTVHI